MAIAGLWHGPAWTFVIFGLLHGVALAANQVWRRRKLPMPGWRIAAILQKDNQTLLKPPPEMALDDTNFVESIHLNARGARLLACLARRCLLS
jgi:hypothetical protein